MSSAGGQQVPDDDNNVLSLRERLRCANAKIDELMKAYGAAMQATGSKDADVQRSYAAKCAFSARVRAVGRV
jgi:hypothetical protein